MDLRGAADYPSQGAQPGFWTTTRIIVWIIIPATIFILSLSSVCWNPGCTSTRNASARVLINHLEQAVRAYELDFAAYPPGDGKGTAGLIRALQSRGSKSPSWFDAEMLPAGDVANPVDGEKIVSYRCPGVHNPKSFDLWCEDRKGRADGINNWEK